MMNVNEVDSSILNEPLLTQYREMDERMTKDHILPRLYNVFARNFPDYLSRLTEGLQAHDPEQVSHFIHKMLGMSHNIGALRLAKILSEWEESTLERKMQIDTQGLETIFSEFKAAEAALGDYIREFEH